MLEQIDYKLRRMNECSSAFADTNKIKGNTVEINCEIVSLWLNVIMFFRHQSSGKLMITHHMASLLTTLASDRRESHLILKFLSKIYDDAMKIIGDAVGRIEKATELTERQAGLIDRDKFRKCFHSLWPKTKLLSCPAVFSQSLATAVALDVRRR